MTESSGADPEPATPPPSAFATDAGTDLYTYRGRLEPSEFDRILGWAALRRASDVTLQPGSPVMAEIAGVWRPITAARLNVGECNAIYRSMYGENAVNALSQGKDLDFAYEFRHPMRDAQRNAWEEGYEGQPLRLRFRVNVTGGRAPGGETGASATLRTLPGQPVEIGTLGIEPEILRHWRPALGLNLICGPTGSGKSTLLASLVRWMCEREGANEKIIEFSSPIEFVYDGLRFPSSFVWQTGAGQHLINPDNRGEGGVWTHCLRNALRRKPSTIILGEARDRYTIEGCVLAALSGHLTVSTLHTIGVPATFRRLVMPFPAGERATISIDLLQVLNLVVTQTLHPRIGGGKVAVREFLVFDRSVRRALEEADHDHWPAMLRAMLATGRTPAGDPVVGQSMETAARALRDAGVLSDDSLRYLASRLQASESGAVEGEG